jgi:hypothetical protein
VNLSDGWFVSRHTENGTDSVRLAPSSAYVTTMAPRPGATAVTMPFLSTFAAFGFVALSVVLSRFLRSRLYGVSDTDALTYISVALLLSAVSLLACHIPARRATKIEPNIALRYE